jgi:glucose-1-phosphate thymidylyltransferase
MGLSAVILGAGYATRLYPLTRNRPKPLLAVGGVPILERIVECIRGAPDLTRIYIVSNHRFVGHYYRWRDEYAERRPDVAGMIEIYDDMTTTNEDRLGAIGDIHFVMKNAKISEDMLVVAGDNLLELDVAEFVRFGRAKGVAIGLKDLGEKRLVSLYGAVRVNPDGRVVDFEEKPPKPETTLVSVGLYFFRSDRLGVIERYLEEGNSPDQPGRLIQWLHAIEPVYGYVIQGRWFDIGDIDSYNRANELFST